MLVIGRALMGLPTLCIFDEPSIGMSPLLIEQSFHVMSQLRDEGITVLLIEQNVHKSLEIADRGYVLENGRIVLEGDKTELESSELLGRAYLEAGQPQQAIETVQPLARNVGSDLGPNAALLQATAHEAAENPAQAEAIYLRIGDDARFLFQRQNGIENAARIRLQSNNPAGAAELYERLVEMTPEESAERQVFEMRAGEARALAAAAQ